MPLRRVRAALLLVAVAACSDSTDPNNRPESDLTILRFAPGAPPLVSNSVTFTACNGVQAEGSLFYDDGSGQGRRFARLRLDDQSLLRRPDGSTFGPGECIDITMAVVDPGSGELLLDLQPTGLRFRPEDPAELEVEYREAEAVTPDIEAVLAIWRQESPGDPFVRIGTVVFDDLDEVEAELDGFSRYALAY